MLLRDAFNTFQVDILGILDTRYLLSTKHTLTRRWGTWYRVCWGRTSARSSRPCRWCTRRCAGDCRRSAVVQCLYSCKSTVGSGENVCCEVATQSSDARDITWLATTYFELVSSACFFSVDRVVNSKYRRIILCLVQKHCFVMHHWAIFNRTESQILYTSDCILLDDNGIKNGPRRVGM